MPLKEEMGREKAKRKSGAPGEIRTPDLLLRRQSLYPSELRAHSSLFSLHAGLRTINASIWRFQRNGLDRSRQVHSRDARSCATHSVRSNRMLRRMDAKDERSPKNC